MQFFRSKRLLDCAKTFGFILCEFPNNLDTYGPFAHFWKSDKMFFNLFATNQCCQMVLQCVFYGILKRKFSNFYSFNVSEF